MKPKYLYHGSAKKLVGDKLIPKQAKDLKETKDIEIREREREVREI